MTSFDYYKNRWLKTPSVGKKTPPSHVTAVSVNGFNNNTKEIYKQCVDLVICPKVIRSQYFTGITHNTILLVYLLLGASGKNVFDNFESFDDP